MFQYLKPSGNSFMLYTVIARDRTHTIFTGLKLLCRNVLLPSICCQKRHLAQRQRTP